MPDTPEIHLGLGQLYTKIAAWPKAEEQFRAECRLNRHLLKQGDRGKLAALAHLGLAALYRSQAGKRKPIPRWISSGKPTPLASPGPETAHAGPLFHIQLTERPTRLWHQ